MVRGPYYVHHRLFTLDPRAITHVMNHPYMYEKPLILRRVLKRYMEEGLIVAEGHRHKVQRKIVQRLFSRNAMKDMTEIIVDKATQVSGDGGFHSLLPPINAMILIARADADWNSYEISIPTS